MLPLWIIDLGSSATSTTRLQNLLTKLGDKQKPYWHYCYVGKEEVTDAESCRALIEKLVEDGRECYNTFIREGYKLSNFHIAILGDAETKLTQQVFAPLADLVRDNLPRIVADHANLGVDITGILFISNTINQIDDTKERTKVAMMLESLNTLYEQLGARHYSHLVAYQDVQYKGVRFYPGLDTEQRTDLLFQILTNLFFVKAGEETLFDKISNNGGIYSLGAASIYYNSVQHSAYEMQKLQKLLIEEFKNTENYSQEHAEDDVRELFKSDVVKPDEITSRFREGCNSVDIDLRKLEGDANPHPVWDLFCSDLIPLYYKKYLRFMPARLRRFMQSLSYILLTRFSGIIRKNREKAKESFISLLHGIYCKVFLDNDPKNDTIAQVEAVYKTTKDYLQKKRSEVSREVYEIVPVPAYLRNDYDHCVADEEANTQAKSLDEIRKNLRREPIVLALLVRCFLLGILLVFTVIPVLRVVSPNVINLGEIATIEWLWIPILFLLPLIIEFFIGLRRHYARIKRLKYRLLAINILAANKRLSSLLYDELCTFYDSLVEECDKQLVRLSTFRKELNVTEVAMDEGVVPQTMFNQPLLTGTFCGEKLLEDETVAEAEINVIDKKVRLSQLKKDDILLLLGNVFRITISRNGENEQSGAIEAVEKADSAGFISIIKDVYDSELSFLKDDSIEGMIAQLGKNINMSLLEKMAGVNGMLFSVPSNNKPDMRFFGDYALLTCWQKLTAGIQSQDVCNCSLNTLPELTFADRLSLYYGFYRNKDLAYSLAGKSIEIPKDEMNKLDKQLKEGKL